MSEPADTKWKPGTSGNPRGRPSGIDSVRALLEPKRDDLTKKALDLALAGNERLLVALLDRLAPMPRNEAARVSLPKLAAAQTLADKAKAVLDGIAGGVIAPDTGRTLLDGLAALARTVEVDELERRIATLEASTH